MPTSSRGPYRTPSNWKPMFAVETSSREGPRAPSSDGLRGGRRDRIGRVPFPGRHEQPDLLLLGRGSISDGDDLAAVEDRDPVRELEDLVELGRHEQDG